jgi:hypothetical protein
MKILVWEIPSSHCQGIIPFNIVIIQFEFLTQKTPAKTGVFVS